LKNEAGYATAFKQSYRPSSVQEFNDNVKNTIRNKLKRDRREQAFTDLTEEIREEANVRIYEDKLFSQIDVNLVDGPDHDDDSVLE